MTELRLATWKWLGGVLVPATGMAIAGCGLGMAGEGSEWDTTGTVNGVDAGGGHVGTPGIVDNEAGATAPANDRDASTSSTAGEAGAADSSGGPSLAISGSSGCGTPAAISGSQSLSLTVGGKMRTYVLSVPANYAPNTPQPLVFGYQGIASSGWLAQQTYALEGTAAGFGQAPVNDRAIFVYPDALVGANPADPGTTDYDDSPTGADFAFFDALITTLESSYCVDPQRVFATGLGGGGTFTNLLGCYRGDVIRAIAPLSSQKPGTDAGGGAATCTGHVATWIAHGENDAYSSFTATGEATRDFWVAQNACSSTTVVDPTTPSACVDYQGCLPGYPVVWCVHDEGHNWPSTSPFVCMDAGVCFDAGPAIWSFFSSF